MNDKNKSWWNKLLGLKQTYKLFLVPFFVCLSAFSNEINIPNFDFNNPNPKVGLYKAPNMKIARYKHKTILLNDGRILILSGYIKSKKYNSNLYSEVYDPTTGKSKLIKMTLHYNPDYIDAKLLPDGRVLISGGFNVKEEKEAQKTNNKTSTYEIFDPQKDSFIMGPKSRFEMPAKVNLSLNKDNKVYAYGKIKTNNGNKLIFEEAIEIYDVSTNSVSEPIKKSSDLYLPYISENYKYIDSNYIENKIGAMPQQFPLKKDIVLLISNGELEYGNLTKNYIRDSYSNPVSWCPPLYLYDINTKKIKKYNDYLRSFRPTIINLKDKKQLFIFGGLVPIYIKNPNISLFDISLRNRFYLYGTGEPTSNSYILVY